MFQTVIHDTALGPLFSTWTSNGLYSMALGDDATRTPEGDRSSVSLAAISVFDAKQVDTFDQRLCCYCCDGKTSFDDVMIDPSGWTPFARCVYECCRQISPGQTMTYKQLAAAAGSKNASRAVGAAMARNRILLVIPCHRVIATNGQLRGFSAPGGLVTKQALLDLEKSASAQPLLAGC